MLGSVTENREPPVRKRGGSQKGRKLSAETRAKMSRSHTGLHPSAEHRQAIATGRKRNAAGLARSAGAALEAVHRELDRLGAVTLAAALESRGIDYATGYNWATRGRSGQLRDGVFYGPRRALCVRKAWLDAELERWRCKWEHDGRRCERYALLSQTGFCHEHRLAEVLREHHKQRKAEAAALREQGVLFIPDIALELGYSSESRISNLISTGRLRADELDVAGVRRLGSTKAAIRSFQRSRTPGIDIRGRPHRRDDPDWEAKRALDSGSAARRAATRGISLSQALAEMVALVELRRRRPAGRPPRGDAPDHHYDWLRRFREIRENYESHAYGGESMPKPTPLCREVALEDYREHPERWPDYEPAKELKAAGDRVWTAIKPLLIAESEILST